MCSNNDCPEKATAFAKIRHVTFVALLSIAISSTTVHAQTVLWSNPSPITYGTPLSSLQLDAALTGLDVLGSFAYTPTNGTVLNAGTNTLTVVFTPIDLLDFIAVTQTVSLVVAKAVPVLTWSNPSSIIYGTSLSSNQLAASANVPGSFTYTPPMARC